MSKTGMFEAIANKLKQQKQLQPYKSDLEINTTNTTLKIVYILYPYTLRDLKASHLKHFFEQTFLNIDNKIKQQPIFFELTKALRCSRYMAGQHIIIKALIPENAIEANAEQLQLRSGVVRRSMLAGVYHPCANEAGYVINRHFNYSLYA